jgi:hypothetical protein
MQIQKSSFFRYFGFLAIACGLVFTTGCGNGKKGEKAEHHEGDGHKEGEKGHGGHAEEGPHNGHLIELGKEEYHVEMIHDDAAHKITLYVLDGAAKKSVPITERELTVNLLVADKPAQFKIPALPQADDPNGQSSRFELVNEPLCEALDDPKSKARLSLNISGKLFSGDMAHEEHGEDHKK